MQQYENSKLHLLEAYASSGGSTPSEKAAILMPYLVLSHSKQPSNEAEVERVFKNAKEDARMSRMHRRTGKTSKKYGSGEDI
ncbi:hypothetical protein ARMGADRAFT_1081072 [Armillaria gallica]|uniref:Uncharacterized protein n=1 Tax=Armillaria gallica TaxID=47427 RepID=A0A2H3DES5_ARMGA|nr:hypothetical protein ARMGADRAFT_1081072 [Armillaria gallica]